MSQYRIKEVSEYGSISYEVEELNSFIFWEYWECVCVFLTKGDAEKYIQDQKSGRKVLSIYDY